MCFDFFLVSFVGAHNTKSRMFYGPKRIDCISFDDADSLRDFFNKVKSSRCLYIVITREFNKVQCSADCTVDIARDFNKVQCFSAFLCRHYQRFPKTVQCSSVSIHVNITEILKTWNSMFHSSVDITRDFNKVPCSHACRHYQRFQQNAMYRRFYSCRHY